MLNMQGDGSNCRPVNQCYAPTAGMCLMTDELKGPARHRRVAKIMQIFSPQFLQRA